MRLSIFSRLAISYISLLILVTGISIYTITQLSRVNRITHSIIVDNYLIDNQKKLTDTLLSEIRYEKKFLIMHDAQLYSGFMQATADFEQNLGQAMLVEGSTEAGDLLNKIKKSHDRYKILFDGEVERLKTGMKSSTPKYDASDREQIVNGIIKDLEKLGTIGEKNILNKIRDLGEAGTKSRTFALAITSAALLFGIVISICITRSITVPLSAIKKKTSEIAAGIFEDDLNLPSPPEIGELASAFNFMCKKLKEVDKLKSDFFSLMSHELRTPLTSIREGTNLLLERLAGDITERQNKLLTIISQESNRLIELVNSLLDLSKMEAGMLTYNFAMAELSPLIQQVIFEVLPIAESRNISVERHMEELPPVNIDTERILQVLRNLIGNALKFAPNGGLVTISARMINKGVEVSVSDNGPGIPKEHLDTIFDKYRQVGQPGSLKGTGLGLAIVKHVINKHGGNVWIESAVGKGCTFLFFLPV